MTPAEWTAILSVLVAAGLGKWATDVFRWIKSRRDGKLPEARQALAISTADQSLTVVARARDELAEDNARLRAERAETDIRHRVQMAETEARHDADRARWELRDKARREEIEILERKLRALLTEVEKLKDRHTFDDIEETRGRIYGS